MGTQKHSAGFTIIEVILFLAISGALAMGVLATSTVGINNQRYQDAVNSFKALVQNEFINTTRVVNTRDDPAACPLTSPSIVPGASECVVMGRLMSVSASGEVSRSNLIGRSNGTIQTTDIGAIRSYAPRIDVDSQESSTMSWGTTPYKGASPAAVSLAIFRSPTSGNVLAFVQRNVEINTDGLLLSFMNGVNFRNDSAQVICIDPSGWTAAQTQVVLISAYAAGPSAVEKRSARGSECA